MWPTRSDCARSAAGVALLAGALACGGKADSDRPATNPTPAARRPVPASPPTRESTPASPAVSEQPTPAPLGEPVEAPSSLPSMTKETDFRKAQVAVILMANCGSCHSADAPAA